MSKSMIRTIKPAEYGEHAGRPETTALDFLSPAAFWQPKRLAEGSAWNMHIPFAFALVDMWRPSCFVELGTHGGNSYFSFCQAIKALDLTTSATAVDTWEGDEQAGLYGEDVFRAVSRYHENNYADFSTLMRMTFDEAVEHFEAGTIDLLHIDGLHTYAAVRHDYDTWLPKLAPNAIVLLHDTNEYKDDFGVYRLWEELAAEHPHFEFLHGHGLGVLGRGTDFPPQVESLFRAARDRDMAEQIRRQYERLGEACQRQAETASLRKRINEERERNSRLIGEIKHLALRTGDIAEGFRKIDRELIRVTHSKRYLLGHICAETFNRTLPAPLRSAIFSVTRWVYSRAAACLPYMRHPAFPDMQRVRMDVYNLLARLGSIAESVDKQGGNGPAADSDLAVDDGPTRAGPDLAFDRVSVVSAVYNKAETLPRFIDAFANQTYAGHIQIILIDDASVDNSRAVVRQLQEAYASHERLTIVHRSNSENMGNCASRNRGLGYATGDAIVIMDADCIVNPDFVESRVQVHRSGYDVCIGPMGIESGRRPVEEVIRTLSADPSRALRESKLQYPEQHQAFVNCVTRNFSITRPMYERLDEPLFDEAFSYRNTPDTGFGWEDIEMGTRLFKRGASVGFTERAFSVHLTHPPEVPDRVKMLGSLRNFNRLLGKHPDLPRHQQAWTTRTAEKIFAWTKRNNAQSEPEVSTLEREVRDQISRVRTADQRIVVYSAIAGGFDVLEDVTRVEDDCAYVAFLDREADGDIRTWHRMQFDEAFEDPCLTAKKPKVLPHVYFPEYEWSVWVDGNILPLDIVHLIQEVEKSGKLIGVFRHPERDCVYDEAIRCVARNKDRADIVFSQVSRYEDAGYPRQNGLAECNVIVRRHNAPEVRKAMCDWWREILNGSRRDQLSFNYVMWKNGLSYAELGSGRTNVRNDHRFHYREHGTRVGEPAAEETRA